MVNPGKRNEFERSTGRGFLPTSGWMRCIAGSGGNLHNICELHIDDETSLQKPEYLWGNPKTQAPAFRDNFFTHSSWPEPAEPPPFQGSVCVLPALSLYLVRLVCRIRGYDGFCARISLEDAFPLLFHAHTTATSRRTCCNSTCVCQ